MDEASRSGHLRGDDKLGDESRLKFAQVLGGEVR
jgi:hypothetical protein